MKVYLLPGRGGKLDKGLGGELIARGHQVRGREIRGEFASLGFGEQVESVAEDLIFDCSNAEAVLIANSFGAYLYLHAQALMPRFAGRVFLLSPIVGQASDEATGMVFVPPRDGKIQKMLTDGTYPASMNGEMHVGALDWQSSPQDVKLLGAQLQWPVHVVEKVGHRLPTTYVQALLNRVESFTR